jgi:phosphoglycolate phosphatase-like HAD superfamily hydrolase
LACRPSEAMVIGDSESDFSAAAAANVEFVLRCTSLNLRLQRTHAGLKCEDFIDG